MCEMIKWKYGNNKEIKTFADSDHYQGAKLLISPSVLTTAPRRIMSFIVWRKIVDDKKIIITESIFNSSFVNIEVPV